MMVRSSSLYYETVTSTIIRLSREDFNPIWTIEEKPQQEVKVGVYPNPSKDKIHFDLSDVPTDGSKRLRIVNFAGQVFIDRNIHGKGNTLTVGVANLPAGIYTYQIYDKEEILFCGKFLIE